VSSPPRDKVATWRGVGYVSREQGWSKPRAVNELQNGLRFQTVPEGHELKIDWHSSDQLALFDLDTSTIKIWDRVAEGALAPCFLTVGIEVLFPPPDVRSAPPEPAPPAVPERKPKPKRKPKRKPAPKRPSDAAVKKCLDDIIQEYPDGPSGERWLLTEMENRLGAPPGRARVRILRREKKYRQWRRPIGHPRNFNSAKNSAA
jgi:hypothetical protein